MEAYETIEKDGFVGSIYPDECAENPFENWDGQGKFYHWKDYGREELLKYCELLGFDPDTRERIGKQHKFAVEIDKYEHSGISYSVKNEGMNCRWDTSSTWAVWFPDKCALDEIMRFKTLKAQKKRAVELAREACTLFNQWANGDVYYYNITDADGEIVESCGGFYGMDAVKEEVNSQIDYLVKERQENLKNTEALVLG